MALRVGAKMPGTNDRWRNWSAMFRSKPRTTTVRCPWRMPQTGVFQRWVLCSHTSSCHRMTDPSGPVGDHRRHGAGLCGLQQHQPAPTTTDECVFILGHFGERGSQADATGAVRDQAARRKGDPNLHLATEKPLAPMCRTLPLPGTFTHATLPLCLRAFGPSGTSFARGLAPITRCIFPQAVWRLDDLGRLAECRKAPEAPEASEAQDDNVLDHLNEDGLAVEPRFILKL